MILQRAKVQDEDDVFLFTTLEDPYPELTHQGRRTQVTHLRLDGPFLEVQSEGQTSVTLYPFGAILWAERAV